MKRSLVTSGSRIRIIMTLGLALSALLVVLLVISWLTMPALLAQEGPGAAFLPVQLAPAPTATPVPTPTPGPPPQFVTNVRLPSAQCPNAAGFNQVSGYMYILNNYSNNVSIFRNRAFENDIDTGEWPTSIASDPQTARTWVTNLHSGVSLLQGNVQTGFVPRSYEPYGVAFNPVNGHVYVTDLDSKVQIIDGGQEVLTLQIIDQQTGKGAGWLRPIVVDPRTGLVYAASWDYGRLWVIEGTSVVDSVQLGWAPLNMAIDSERGLIYVAHSDPNETYPHDISVVELDTLKVTPISSRPGSVSKARDVAVDMRSGLAYITHPNQDTVSVLKGAKIVGTIAVGDQPWGVGVNPNDGYAFVTNRLSNDVSILLNGVLRSTVAVQGESPFAVGVDTNRNDIYIANRGEEYGLFKCKKASVTILH